MRLVAEAKSQPSGGEGERPHEYFVKTALAVVILFQFAIVYLLLSNTAQTAVLSSGPVAQNCERATQKVDQLSRAFVEIFNSSGASGASGSGGSGAVDGSDCTVTQAGGRTIIVTREKTLPGENTRTIVLTNNNTETIIILNNTGVDAQGTPGVPGADGQPGQTGFQPEAECYTVTVCPSGGNNQTPTCPAPTTTPSCVLSGLLCGDHPSAQAGATCCEGLTCQNGYCLPPPGQACSTSGPCTTTADCCSGLACTNGQCGLPQACKSISEICFSSSECCEGFSCQGSTCQPTPQQPTCSDSDNGLNFEVLGVTNGAYNGVYGTYADYCRPTGESPPLHVYNQVEYACTGNGSEVRGVAIGCSYGCANGVCLPQPFSCTDSDGSDNMTRGTVAGTNASGLAGNFTDYCDSSSSVYEYTCASNRVVTGRGIPCAYGCLNGACQPATQQQTCIDSDGGLDYNNTGTVTLSPSGAAYTDHCGISTQDLVEYYCSSGNVANTTAYCNYLCSGGKCSPPPPPTPQWCNDSDNGANYLVKGMLTTGGGVNVTDYCTSSTKLREYRCFSANSSSMTSEEVTCVNVGPSICNNGACGG